MAISYQQRCMQCKKNMVLVTRGTRFVVCYGCQKKELHGPIKDPAMKKLFNIPEKLYEQSGFLRSIKVNYLKFGELSEKQKEYFVKVSKELTNPAVPK